MNILEHPGRRSAAAIPIALRARDVADLAVVSGFPCISVLLPTQPEPRMTRADAELLQRLLAEVDQQLSDLGLVSRDRLMTKLRDEAHRSASQPTGRALAIYVSLAVSRSFRLPQPVEPRAIVEGTFATRPLVSALHRMPPHVVLVLHATCAHLYAAADGGLRPVRRLDPFQGNRPIRLPRPGEPGAAEVRRDVDEGYLRAVDKMVGEYRAEHPSPMVLAGAPRLLDRFCGLSRNLERLAGRVAPSAEDTALDLAMSSLEIIEAYLRNRREDALEQLGQALRSRPSDVAAGIEGCWSLLRSRSPGMLLVEESFVSPGTVTTATARADTQGRPGEVHDLVDDLIEQVILHGGQLALVRDGDLESHGRIALTSRPKRP